MPPSDEIYYIDADLATAPPTGAGKDKKSKSGRRRRRGRSLLGDETVAEVGGGRPTVAGSLSLLLCGAGQIYNGRKDLATLYFLTEVFFVSMSWLLWSLWDSVVETVGLFSIKPTDVMFVATTANFLFLMFLVFNVLQAHKDAAAGQPAVPLGLALVSTPASLLIPGWGQILNGQPRKGALLLGVFLTAAYAFGVSLVFEPLWRMWDSSYQMIFGYELTMGGLIALLIALIAYLYAFYDALVVARRQKAGTY